MQGVPHLSSETEGLSYRVVDLRMPNRWSCHLSRGLPADETNLLGKGGCLHTHHSAISKGPPVIKTRAMSSLIPVRVT